MRDGETGSAPEEEWLTVAEAADRLGLNVRQARRYADRLRGTKDRTGQDVSPARILLSALHSQMAKAGTGTASEGQRTGQGQDKDTEGQGQGQGVSSAVERELRTRLETQQDEIEFLRAALEREQENTKGALARLEEAESRSKVLIAAAGQGRLPAPQDGGETSQDGAGVSAFSSAPTRAQEGESDQSGNAGTAARRGWWARLWERKK